MKNKLIYILPVAAVLLCVLCFVLNKAKPAERERTVFAMDTVMNIKLYGGSDAVLDSAEKEIIRLDNLLSRGKADSDISKINSNTACTVSSDTAELLSRAVEICSLTDGSFDMTIAPVMDLWGFFDGDFYVPTDAELAKVLAEVNYKDIALDGDNVKNPTLKQVDLGGIAKGFTSDRVAQLLTQNGVKSAVISLGGNVHALGTQPNGEKWNIAVQDPFDSGAIAGAVRVSDSAVITSGGYQRNFERDGVLYHHIIDPKTGKPANSGLSSVTVIGKSGVLADGLSTSLFVMGLEKGGRFLQNNPQLDVDAVLIDNGGKIYVTAGIAEDFYSDRAFTVIK